MGTANRDASQITMRNRNKALNSYYDAWKSATVNSSAPTQGLKAPAGTSAEVVAQVQAGCVACTIYTNTRVSASNPDPNQTLYPSNLSRGGASSTTNQS